MGSNLSGLRGRQILSAIREHGPLSIEAITSFLEPPTNRRRVAQAMKLLSEKGAVRKYNGSLPDNAGHHYALNLTRGGREVISKILGMSTESLTYAAVPGTEFKHGEQCAILAERFRKRFPEARIVRDWELNTCLGPFRTRSEAESPKGRGEDHRALSDRHLQTIHVTRAPA